MPSTSRFGLRYPLSTDSNNPPLDLQKLASDVEARLSAMADGTVIGHTGVGNFGVRVTATPTNTPAILQFTNFAENAQWSTISATSAGALGFGPYVSISPDGSISGATAYFMGGTHAPGASPAWQMYGDNTGVQFRSVANAPANVWANSYQVSSTRRLKSDIRPTSVALATVLALDVVDYHYSADEAATTRTGLIAEDVREVLPSVVALDDQDQAAGIDYAALVPVLVKAVQELAARVERLEASG